MKKSGLPAALRQILPAPADSRNRFISRVLGELEAFNELTLPLARNLRTADVQLERLQEATKLLARSVAAVKQDVWDLIEMDIVVIARQAGQSGDAAVSYAASAVAGMKMASLVSRVAGQRRAKMRARSAPPGRMAFTAFVKTLARLYADAYGARPSASPAGYFGKALSAICEAEGISSSVDDAEPAQPSEEWLHKIIKGVAADAPAPKRGRKARA